MSHRSFDSADSATLLLQRAEAALAAAPSLTFNLIGSLTDQRPERDPLLLVTAQVALQRPNLARVVVRERQLRRQGGWQERQRLLIGDGTSRWEWDSVSNTYRQEPLDPQGRNLDGPGIVPLRMFFHGQIPHAEEPPRRGSRDSAIVFATPENPPLVHQELFLGRDGLPQRWINQQLGGRYRVEWELTQVQVGKTLPKTQFAFVPPAQAKLWEPPKLTLLERGTPAPELLAVDRSGKPVRLTDFRGKRVVLDFWASWCGPCQETLPLANALAKKYRPDVVFLAVNVWDKPAAAVGYLEKHPGWDALTFAFDHTPQGQDVATVAYKLPGLPTQYVLDREGRVLGSTVGFGSPAALEKLLQG